MRDRNEIRHPVAPDRQKTDNASSVWSAFKAPTAILLAASAFPPLAGCGREADRSKTDGLPPRRAAAPAAKDPLPPVPIPTIPERKATEVAPEPAPVEVAKGRSGTTSSLTHDLPQFAAWKSVILEDRWAEDPEIGGTIRDVLAKRGMPVGELTQWDAFDALLTRLEEAFPAGEGYNYQKVADDGTHPLNVIYNRWLQIAYYDLVSVLLTKADLSTNDTDKKLSTERAQRALKGLSTYYYLANQGYVPGFMHFTDGPTRLALEHGDREAAKLVVLLATRASFSRVTVESDFPESAMTMREIAYAIKARCNAKLIRDKWPDEFPPDPTDKTILLERVDQALSHLEQVKNPASWVKTPDAPIPVVAPFMVGLQVDSLWHFYKTYGASEDREIQERVKKVKPALIEIAQWLAREAWIPNLKDPPEGAAGMPLFVLAWSENRVALLSGDKGWAPGRDLNLLVWPLFDRLVHDPDLEELLKANTKDSDLLRSRDDFRQLSEAMFEGGVSYWASQLGKQRNQGVWLAGAAVRENHSD